VTEREQQQLAAAYQAAAQALATLRQALAEAGVALPDDGAAAREARRREADRERSRRRRERSRVTPETVTVRVTRHGEKRDSPRDAVGCHAQNRDNPRDAEGRAPTRVPYREDLSTSPPLSFAPLKTNPTPTDADVISGDPDALAILAALEDTTPPAPEAPSAGTAPVAMAQERPALRPGRTNATPDGSVEGPAAPDAPAAKRGRRPPAGPDAGTDAARVWEAYLAAVAPLGLRPRWVRSRGELLQRRLATWSVEDLGRSIQGYLRSGFHTGQNDGGKLYLDPELLWRNDQKVEAGLAYLDAKRPVKRGPVVHGIEDEWSAHFARRDGHETAERSEA
jgi:hypothetical protein